MEKAKKKVELESTEKLSFNEIVFIMRNLNSFKEINRKVRKSLDELETLLQNSIEVGESEEKQFNDLSEIEKDSIKLFTGDEFEAMIDGIPFHRGDRKSLTALLTN